MAAPPPPPPPPPSQETLRKGTALGRRLDYVPVPRESTAKPKGYRPICGTKLPELVFPKDSEERAKGPKVFRFLKPPIRTPESPPKAVPPSTVKASPELRRVPAFGAGPRFPPGVIPPPPPPPPLGQPGAEATRKWAPVKVNEPGKKEQGRPHIGVKLPELVLPNTRERAKVKVFRFLKPPKSSSEESASGCRIDTAQPPPVNSLSPTASKSARPAQTSPPVVQKLPIPSPPPRPPKKLPNVAGSADLTFKEQLQLRSQANVGQQQATESREHESQQTLPTLEPRPIPAARTEGQRASTYRQVAASQGIRTIHELPARPEADLPGLEPPPSPQSKRYRPQSLFDFPPQQARQLERTTQPQKCVPRCPPVPAPPKLRLGPHKYATPYGQQPPAPSQ